MEWYRDDLDEHQKRDPLPILKSQLIENGIEKSQLVHIEKIASKGKSSPKKLIINKFQKVFCSLCIVLLELFN